MQVLAPESESAFDVEPSACAIKKLDVVIVSYERSAMLGKCLRHLQAAAEKVRGCIEVRVLIGLNGEQSGFEEMFDSVEPTLSALKCQVFEWKQRLAPSSARNRILKCVSGDWIFFVDDDAYAGEKIFESFLETCQASPHASVIGGPNLTPNESSLFQRASGAALSSRFGAFVSCVRYSARSPRAQHCGDEALILCNLFVRREEMKTLQFPESFVCNEENWILQDLKFRSKIMIYEPSMFVWHERRGHISAFAAQIHKYGMGRGQNIRLRPKTSGFGHIAPPLSLVFTIMTLALSIWFPTLLQIWFGLFVSYLALWIGATVRLKVDRSELFSSRILGGALFPVIHISYGAGVLRGLLLPVD